MSYTILVGTVGTGVFRSTDGGETFKWTANGISCNDVVVRGFAVDPSNHRHVLMGTAVFDSGTTSLGTPFGLHETFDGGESWKPIEFFRGIECWRIVFDKHRPGRYYVGTRPAGLIRFDPEKQVFEKRTTPFPTTCRGIGLPRITSIVLHPNEPDFIFVSVEIGGFFRSLDGGNTWSEVLSNIDIPDMPVPNGNVFGAGSRYDGHHSVLSAGDPALLIASTPDGSYVSKDLGETWDHFPVLQVFPRQYHHDLILKLDDPNTIFYGVGEETAGVHGALLRSCDRGRTWQSADFPEACNAPIWCFAQHPSNPRRILACTHYGMLYRSENGGDSWTKAPREFTEIRAVCWVPN
jgi:photosystem II stability/assembly factor-like uncharacterized protein